MSTYSKEFKAEAIRLSDEIGVKKAAVQLGIPYYTLADWRNRSKHKPKEEVVMSEEELRIRYRELESEIRSVIFVQRVNDQIKYCSFFKFVLFLPATKKYRRDHLLAVFLVILSIAYSGEICRIKQRFICPVREPA